MSLKDKMQFSNFASTTLAEAISSSATQLRLAGNASAFPTLGEDQIFTLVVSEEDKYEIMYCTARNGDLLTVERAQENTTARSFSTSARVVHTVTAAFFESFEPPPPPSSPAVLLLHFDALIAPDPPASYASSYIDSSPNGFHVSMPGWAKSGVTDIVSMSFEASEKKFGAGALGGVVTSPVVNLYVEPDADATVTEGGRGAYLEEFGFGVGDFTIECWVYRYAAGLQATAVLAIEAKSGETDLGQAVTLIIDRPTDLNGTEFIFSGGAFDLEAPSIPSDEWVHLALSVNTEEGVRTGRFYVNGALVDSNDLTGNDLGNVGRCMIRPVIGGSTLRGYLDEIRITKGVGLYPTEFDPPTEPFS